MAKLLANSQVGEVFLNDILNVYTAAGINGENSAGGSVYIHGVSDPVNAGDVVNKSYLNASLLNKQDKWSTVSKSVENMVILESDTPTVILRANKNNSSYISLQTKRRIL